MFLRLMIAFAFFTDAPPNLKTLLNLIYLLLKLRFII